MEPAISGKVIRLCSDAKERADDTEYSVVDFAAAPLTVNGFPLVQKRQRRIRFALEPPARADETPAVAEAAAEQSRPAQISGGDAGGSLITKKQCICSPTGHAGSFRCRHHQREYVWVGRRLAGR
ncbi:hypothetical protein SAY86_031113 [Trapa natans]|uniref:Uncharacterized protein n=1 Tax=Trapa natans TaxID=22666 RepID=A0AAN7MH03_TRANT|nr:hypothetical protein SAY86_031113 [Trapa natans]